MKYDFSGWATKNDLRCSDGRIIRHGAFKVQDGKKVPLVWNHQHNDVKEVLGHGILENRDKGVYVYGAFNDTPSGQHAKECLKHGDIESLSIWANNLQQDGPNVLHGEIREVSLVLAGANPGAFVESVVAHSMPLDDLDDEGIFYTGEPIETNSEESPIVSHAEKEEKPASKESEEESKEEEPKEKTDTDETVEDVYKTLTDKQKLAVAVMVGMAVSDGKEEKEKEEETEMKHNIFDQESGGAQVRFLSHSEMQTILEDAKSHGSLRKAYNNFLETNELQHAAIPTNGMEVPSTSTATQTYGIRDMDMLFPDYKSLNVPPEFISRSMTWVDTVMNGVGKTGFARIRSMYADITEDEARARGYIKGKQKKEEVFTILKRTTAPQTIYKKQKLDRDDIIDITDFDVVAWIRSEMEIMLREEQARAILIGDGRPTDSDDKIKEDNIRPIAKDVDLFTVKVPVEVSSTDTAADVADKTIDAAVRGRKHYKGSGNPTFFTTEDTVTEMLLLKDKIGHKIYKTEDELATALRVSKIETVEPMEGQKITIDGTEYELIGIIVNLSDYRVGMDKGGEKSFFDQFDIDFNQMKYLLEVRMSGALVKPFSALSLYKKVTTTTGGGGSDDENQ